MNKHGALLFALMMPLFACDADDAVTTARAQSRVNLQLDQGSEVQVTVRGGRATLTGIASNDVMRVRAVQAARSVDGVRTIDDEISTPPSLTGATVPR